MRRTASDMYKWGGERKNLGPSSKSRVGTLSLVRRALENPRGLHCLLLTYRAV